MAYFNFKLLDKYNLTLQDIINFQVIKQNKYDDNSNIIDKYIEKDSINNYIKNGYITFIKSGKTYSEQIRLTNKGISILDTLEMGDVTDDDIKILDWLIKVYNLENKAIGNKKRIASGIANFRVNTGIEKNNLALLLKTFINDEKNFEYSQKLEYLFFNSKNIYQRKFILDDCKLYEYYLKNKNYFNNKFN